MRSAIAMAKKMIERAKTALTPTMAGRTHLADLLHMPGARSANASVRAPNARIESQLVTSFRSSPKRLLLDRSKT